MGKRLTHTEDWWTTAAPHIIRCVGHYKTTGERCRSEAIGGGTVCRKHGGAAEHVVRAAAVRIQMAADEAAKRMVEWLNDPSVDMRERVKIAQDIQDRAGLAGAQKHLIGLASLDPVEQPFQDILTTPGALAEPSALPVKTGYDYRPEAHDEDEDLIGDVVDAELVEDPSEDRAILAAVPESDDRPQESAKMPKHIREALKDLL